MKNIVQNIYYSGFNELMLLKKRFYTVKLIFFPEKNFPTILNILKKIIYYFKEKKFKIIVTSYFFHPNKIIRLRGRATLDITFFKSSLYKLYIHRKKIIKKGAWRETTG